MHETSEWVHDPGPSADAPRKRSPYEEEEWSSGSTGYYKVCQQGSNKDYVTRCGLQTLKICVAHVHNRVQLSKPCTELRSMNKT